MYKKIIIKSVVLVFLLLVLSVIIIKTLSNPEEKIVVDPYAKYLGEWSKPTETADSSTVALTINNYNGSTIDFGLTTVQSQGLRVANISMAEISNIRISPAKDVVTFDFNNDGWYNSGIGIITFYDDHIELSCYILKENENALWSIQVPTTNLYKTTAQ